MLTATSATPAANPWLARTVRIAGITPEIPDVYTYDLEFVDSTLNSTYQFRPGQFNMLYLPGVGESAISISAHPRSRGRWAHTIRTAGNVTQALAKMNPGDTLGLRGPFGSCWPVADYRGWDVVFVAGGIGLPPLRPAIYQILEQRSDYGQVSLVYGAKSPDTLMYPSEYDAWKSAGMQIETTVDRAPLDWKGHVGTVTVVLDRLKLARPSQTVLLTCGPDVMMHFTAKSALKLGLKPEQIWLSSERNMQCAVGFCGHCQLGPAFVCKDGPVFRYDRLAPYFRVEGL
ncbi:MAG: FAD/NAD(P)-binding protein [Planctomycetes bacterium]|nr:FAD/NAD(P)-binding protein [Planctomycetota bacterium]